MGYSQGLTNLFRGHPIAFPAVTFLIGAVVLALQLTSGVIVFYLADLAVIMCAVGVLTFPVGIVIATRRVTRAKSLRCPRCGAESHSSARPFSVEQVPHVDYAYVICSNCGADFTVDKYTAFK